MKKSITVLLCLLLALTCCFSAGASYVPVEPQSSSSQVWIDEDSGVTVIDELIVQDLTRSSTKSVTRKQTYIKNDNTIAIITLTAEFSYTGSSVSVGSKSVSQCTTYNGWKFSQTSLSSSGGTASLSGKLTKFLNASVPVNISITCDANGNIT